MTRSERVERARVYECVALQTIAALDRAVYRVRTAVLAETQAALHGRGISPLVAALHQAQLADLEAQTVAAVCSLWLARRARERAEAMR